MQHFIRTSATLGLAVTGLLSAPAAAAEITVTVENTMASDSFFFTPFWVSFHDGSFDSYDSGALASGFPGLTELAEGGDTGPISSAFSTSSAGLAGGIQDTITAVSSSGDAPVFSPGESASRTIDIGDATLNRYFSYASMVVPSNDLFVANGDPLAHALFDAAGNFNGPVTIDIFGGDVNDNGSEVNDAFGDAAFSANGGARVAETELIRSLFSDAGDGAYLQAFVGTNTANGATIGSTFAAGDLIGRIRITPTPGAACLLVLAGVAGGRRRRS